jgi:hypothetical protein
LPSCRRRGDGDEEGDGGGDEGGERQRGRWTMERAARAMAMATKRAMAAAKLPPNCR